MARNVKHLAAESIASGPGATIRMYRHGLGDSFLVRFTRSGHSGTYNILIDCGLISVASNPKSTMQSVVQDIGTVCHGHIDLLILTHEHWDHVSAFSTQQVQEEFDKISIGEVWYAWTESPTDKLAKQLRAERSAKLTTLQAAAAALLQQESDLARVRSERLLPILQYFGFESEAEVQAIGASGDAGAVGKTRAAFEYPGHRPGVRVRYCRPSDEPTELAGVDGVRVYVLGPPEDEALLKRSSPTKAGKEAYGLAQDQALDEHLAMAFTRLRSPSPKVWGEDCPFKFRFSCFPDKPSCAVPAKLVTLRKQHWFHPEEQWRRIDLDWTASAETLALNLDSHTNNTCLVVAFELVQSGRVLLFAADAQVGNWLSWQNAEWNIREGGTVRRVTGPQLLQNTVFYKVGHHGSHNATLKAAGLELMTRKDLVAFIPVFKAQAEKNRWREMPFAPLVKRLNEKTQGRLVMSDLNVRAPTQEDLGGLPQGQQTKFLQSLSTTDLYYEYFLEV